MSKEAVKQLQEKEDKIARFDQLSAHLENMLQLKCERIDELQHQVEQAVQRLKPLQQAGKLTHPHTQPHPQPHNKRGLRLKKRIRHTTKNNSIVHKKGTISNPGNGDSFPVKVSQMN